MTDEGKVDRKEIINSVSDGSILRRLESTTASKLLELIVNNSVVSRLSNIGDEASSLVIGESITGSTKVKIDKENSVEANYLLLIREEPFEISDFTGVIAGDEKLKTVSKEDDSE